MTLTLLEQLENAGVKIDVDSFDPGIAKSLPFKPHDATSNQALIGLQVLDPAQKYVVLEVVQAMPGAPARDVLTVLHAKFGKKILPHLSGRVLAQVSPIFGYDKEKIVDHARAYAKAFEAEGITKDRFCIKIPTTSCGVKAAVVLQAEGIETLGTAMFSVEQALAAAQAGMHAVSPYFNATRAHSDAKYWPDVEDVAKDHPFAPRQKAIRALYDQRARDTGKAQPLIKGASHLTGREVLAQLELGCDHVTVLPGPLDDLLAASQIHPYAKGGWGRRTRSIIDQPHLILSDWKASKPTPRTNGDTNAHSNGGERDLLEGTVLDGLNKADPLTADLLPDALNMFTAAEEELLVYIKGMQEAQ